MNPGMFNWNVSCFLGFGQAQTPFCMSFQLNFLNSVGFIYSLLVMIFHVYCLWGTSLSQTLFYLSQLALVFILSVLPLSQHRLLSWPSFSLEISTPYCTCRKIILPTHYFHHITTCFMNLEGLPDAFSIKSILHSSAPGTLLFSPSKDTLTYILLESSAFAPPCSKSNYSWGLKPTFFWELSEPTKTKSKALTGDEPLA